MMCNIAETPITQLNQQVPYASLMSQICALHLQSDHAGFPYIKTPRAEVKAAQQRRAVNGLLNLLSVASVVVYVVGLYLNDWTLAALQDNPRECTRLMVALPVNVPCLQP